MGFEYALVHLTYTIPPAIVLTIIALPLLTRLDLYKICFLITIAVVYTTPWDAYLIYTKIWSYPPNVILGPTLFGIPIEEFFFFVIQTYLTTLVYILLNKSTLFASYLQVEAEKVGPDGQNFQTRKRLGQILFSTFIVIPLIAGEAERNGTYMRLICVWSGPVLFTLWSLSYQLLLTLPQSKTRLAIAIPTLYLWIVDTLALRRGTWSIGTGTKLGINLWDGLEVEEAVFFLVTNTLVVFGLVAFDNAVAVLDAFPEIFPEVTELPSPKLLVEALLVPNSSYDPERLSGLRNALAVLAKKSRSFYLASGVFWGRLRIDLILLYAFCRVADDLVDRAENPREAERWISNLTQFLKVAYSRRNSEQQFQAALEPFPPEARSILALLPIDRLPPQPLYSLLDGFRSDLEFVKADKNPSPTSHAPIKTEDDLERYATCVASTVAELCLSLVYYHCPPSSATAPKTKQICIESGRRMGLALQYVNVARDVMTDAEDGRCYIPSTWFQSPAPTSPKEFQAELTQHRKRILDLAFTLYMENRGAIEVLPDYARGGIRVAVESYMEIGRVMRERIQRGEKLETAGGGKEGRATVSKHRRLFVGWSAMAGMVDGADEGNKPWRNRRK